MRASCDIDDVLSALKEITESLMPAAIRRGMEKACLKIEASAREKAPADKGRLRASIKSEVKTSGEIEGHIFSTAEYAPYVHEGTGIYAENGRQTPWVYKTADGKFYTTRGQKPCPFLRDALAQNRGEILKSFKGELKK